MCNHNLPKELKPGVIVWAYLRDSSSQEQEQSISQQKDQITAYCDRHGLILGMIFTDECKSGGSAIKRDAFNDLIERTADPNSRPAGLLLWNLTRFSRNLDDFSYYNALFRQYGIAVHSLTDPIPDERSGGIIETIIDFSNEEKRRQNSRDVKRALQNLTKQGFACGGHPPPGYMAEKVVIGKKQDGSPHIVSRWIPDPDLWELVKLAWKLRAEGKTYGEIRDATGGKLYKSKNSFASFFKNKTYLGIGKCGDLEVPDHHEAAIDLGIWEKVQTIVQSILDKKKRPSCHPSL